MKKTTKGALAAGVAGVLLLGGAGSLAYWTAEGSADLGSVTTGTMTLNDGTCGAWTLDAAGDGGTFDPATSALVPGDSLTRTCTYTVTAKGDHLSAKVGIEGGDGVAIEPDTAQGADLTAAATFEVGGQTVVNGGDVDLSGGDTTLTADITVSFPYGTNDTDNAQNGNGTQGLTATLDSIAVTLTQTHAA